jgi:O-antigen ligase
MHTESRVISSRKIRTQKTYWSWFPQVERLPVVRFLILIPIFIAFILLEMFIGGARLLYAVAGVSLVALAGLLSPLPSFKISNRANIPALTAALAFAAYILVRNRFSEIEYIARLQFFTMAGSLLIYLLFSLLLTRPADRKGLLWLLMILALLQMIPAIVQFTQDNQWMPFPWTQRMDHAWRASGLFISPNNFAGFLEIVALLATSFTLWGRAAIAQRVLTGYIALACITGVAISGSRGGYLSLVFSFVVLLVLTLLAWRRLGRDHFVLAAAISTGVAALLFGGILLIVFMSPNLGDRVMQINDPGNMRLLLWRSALEQFHLSPIWGTGGFSFLYFGRLFRDPTVQNDPIHVHDDYLQLLADYGSVGALLFLIFLLLHLRAGIASFLKLSARTVSRSADLHSDRLALNIGALSAVAAYLVHSVVDFNMQLPLNALMMAALLAVLANPGAPREESPDGGPGEFFRNFLRYLLPVLSLAVLIFGIRMIPSEYMAARARIALSNGDYREALEWARKGTVNTHDNPDLYFYRGQAALEEAYDDHTKRDHGQVALRLEAAGAFASGLKVFPYDSRLALKLAQAQAAIGDYYSAIDSVGYAEKLDPNSGFVPAYRGLIEHAFGNLEDAHAAFSQAIDMGGEGAAIAQSQIGLVEKEQKAQEQAQDETPAPSEAPATHSEDPGSNDQSPSSASPSPDTTESGSDLMHVLPAGTPSPAKTPSEGNAE